MARIGLRNLNSIGGFIIITVVLAAIVIGVVLFVKSRGEAVREEQAIGAAAQTDEDSSTDGEQIAVDVSEGDAEQTAPAATDTNEDEAVAAATELPTSGPEHTLVQLAIIAMVGFATTSYIVSRRSLSRQNRSVSARF